MLYKKSDNSRILRPHRRRQNVDVGFAHSNIYYLVRKIILEDKN